MRRNRFLLLCFALTAFLAVDATSGADEAGGSAGGGGRRVQPASGEAEAAISQFRVPPGFKVELFAAEPRVANISSFDIDPTNSNVIHVGLGDNERALAELDSAYVERAWGMFTLRVDPTFDSLRADPRFGRLLKKVGLVS